MATVRKRKWKTSKGEARSGFAVDYFDGQGTRQRKQFTSRAEANDFRVEIEGQLRSGTFRPDAAKITVAEAANLFLAHCKTRMERRERMTRRNYQVYEGYVRNYICPDAEWHARKHATASHAFDYFEKGIGRKTPAPFTVGTRTEVCDEFSATGPSGGPPPQKIGV